MSMRYRARCRSMADPEAGVVLHREHDRSAAGCCPRYRTRCRRTRRHNAGGRERPPDIGQVKQGPLICGLAEQTLSLALARLRGRGSRSVNDEIVDAVQRELLPARHLDQLGA
jgi:hypothetical protein